MRHNATNIETVDHYIFQLKTEKLKFVITSNWGVNSLSHHKLPTVAAKKIHYDDYLTNRLPITIIKNTIIRSISIVIIITLYRLFVVLEQTFRIKTKVEPEASIPVPYHGTNPHSLFAIFQCSLRILNLT